MAGSRKKRRTTVRRKKKKFIKKKYITTIVSVIVFLISYFGDKYNLGQKGMPSDDTYRVLSVSDGDTVTINDHGEKRKLRLYGIDAPEKDQEYGMESRQYLYDRIQGKDINIDFISKDRYGRDISIIYINGENINEIIDNKTSNKELFWAVVNYSSKNQSQILENKGFIICLLLGVVLEIIKYFIK